MTTARIEMEYSWVFLIVLTYWNQDTSVGPSMHSIVKRMLSEFVMPQQSTLEQALKLPSGLTTRWGLVGPSPQPSTFPVCLQFKHLALNSVGHAGMTNYTWPTYSQLSCASFFSSYTTCFGAIIPWQISFPFMGVFSHSMGRSTHLLLLTQDHLSHTGST